MNALNAAELCTSQCSEFKILLCVLYHNENIITVEPGEGCGLSVLTAQFSKPKAAQFCKSETALKNKIIFFFKEDI